MSRPLPGAVAFVQRFGSALQLTPHFHVLVPEAVFEEVDEAELVLRSTTAQAILEHLRLPSRPLPLAPATSPPQLRLW